MSALTQLPKTGNASTANRLSQPAVLANLPLHRAVPVRAHSRTVSRPPEFVQTTKRLAVEVARMKRLLEQMDAALCAVIDWDRRWW